MNQLEFYQVYIPALIKALMNEDKWEQFEVKDPEYYLDVPDDKLREIDIYLDQTAGHDQFLDHVAYYFDAKSHGFDEIDGVKIEIFRKNIENEIMKYKEKYAIE